MKFETKKELEALKETFKAKALSLTSSLKPIGDDPEVVFNCILLAEEYKVDDPDNEGSKLDELRGDVYVYYVRQPNIITSVRVFDEVLNKRIVNAGLMAWDSMILERESSPEICLTKYKLGICAILYQMIKAEYSDIKKN